MVMFRMLRQNEEVLHHAGVFMRKDMTVKNGLSCPLLEAHADDRCRILCHPNGVLDETMRWFYARNRDNFKVVVGGLREAAASIAIPQGPYVTNIFE